MITGGALYEVLDTESRTRDFSGETSASATTRVIIFILVAHALSAVNSKFPERARRLRNGRCARSGNMRALLPDRDGLVRLKSCAIELATSHF